MDHRNASRLARKLHTDMPRMRRLLAGGVEFDPAAVRELSRLSGSLRDIAASAGGTALAQIANQLLVTLQQMAMPSHHASVVEELALRHLFFKLQSAASQVH
jgi:transcription termination factor Rho